MAIWGDFQGLIGVTGGGRGVKKLQNWGDVIYGCSLMKHDSKISVVKINLLSTLFLKKDSSCCHIFSLPKTKGICKRLTQTMVSKLMIHSIQTSFFEFGSDV